MTAPTLVERAERLVKEPTRSAADATAWIKEAAEEIQRLTAALAAAEARYAQMIPELPPRPPDGSGLPRYGLIHDNRHSITDASLKDWAAAKVRSSD